MRGGGRAETTLVGELVGAGRGAAAQPAFVPGPPVAIQRSARGGARVGDLVRVSMRGRAGRVTQVYGPASSPRAALRALLVHEGVGDDFPRAVLADAEGLPDEGAADRGRRDLRHQPVVTVDPEGAKDHDDAVLAEEEPGGLRVWVHIADVARYVTAGGPIDREAARRGNSVYVPGRVQPMLPPRLSADLCSLRPGVERNAVTVEIGLAPDGTVRDARFSRSRIRSERRLTYPEVDRVLQAPPDADGPLEAHLRRAAHAAGLLRARRLTRGALEVESGEPVVAFAGDRVAGIRREGQTPAHSLVEELMVAANEAVARFLLGRDAATVYRFHEDPAEVSVLRLYEQLEELGVRTPPRPDPPLSPLAARAAAVAAAGAVGAHLGRSGGRAAGRDAGRDAGPALWSLVLRALRQACYAPDRVGHSGLASAAYLHFTSPIRRYPDLLVHRALLDALGLGGPGPDRAEVAAAAAHSSQTERAAATTERRADAICAAYLLRDRLAAAGGELSVEGRVTGVIDAGLFVTFDEVFEGFLPSRRLEDDHYRADPLGVALEGMGTGRRFPLGAPVEARIVRVEPLRGRVELEPVGAAPRARVGAGGRRRGAPR